MMVGLVWAGAESALETAYGDDGWGDVNVHGWNLQQIWEVGNGRKT